MRFFSGYNGNIMMDILAILWYNQGSKGCFIRHFHIFRMKQHLVFQPHTIFLIPGIGFYYRKE